MQRSLWISHLSATSVSVLNILDSEQTKQKKIHWSFSNSKGQGDLPCLLFCHATFTLFIGVTPEFRVRVPTRAAPMIQSCQWKEAHDINPGPKESSYPAPGNQTNYFNLLLWNNKQVQKTTQNKSITSRLIIRCTDCTVIGTRVKKQTPSMCPVSISTLCCPESNLFPGCYGDASWYPFIASALA